MSGYTPNLAFFKAQNLPVKTFFFLKNKGAWAAAGHMLVSVPVVALTRPCVVAAVLSASGQ